jgi:hypothetical protein
MKIKTFEGNSKEVESAFNVFDAMDNISVKFTQSSCCYNSNADQVDVVLVAFYEETK